MKIKHEPVTTHVLPNGLGIVHVHHPHATAGYCGLAIKAGSRDDGESTLGLAHFVEHTIFKGTRRRSASRITCRMEAVGGELSAYTTKEETVIYSVFPRGNLARAAELIADIVTGSTFPEEEIDKEREIIADEIDSYLDMPSEAVADDFEDLAFAGSPLGHNILGTSESIKTIRSATCREFLQRNYRAGNMVAFYCGPQPSTTAMPVLERHFSAIAPGEAEKARQPAVMAPVFSEVRQVMTHQSHCIIGASAPSLMDDRRIVTTLLADIMGGPGMNSLLNMELRERRGLVYTVEASTAFFSDCGLLTIYFGCDPEDLRACIDITRRTISSLAGSAIQARKLDKAKKQFLGQLIVASDNRENSVLSAARSLLWHKRVTSNDETMQQIADITPEKLRAAAESLVSASSLVFSPR